MNHVAWFLPALLAVSMGSVHLLPQAGDTAHSAISMEFPARNQGWNFENIPPSKEEIETLSNDTQFAKAICHKARPGEMNWEGYLIPDRIDLSVVLSGNDPSNSIHRPERCMPAQGHEITASTEIMLKRPDGSQFPVKRLRSIQTLTLVKDNSTVSYDCLTYYFFVGQDTITNDHLKRTLIDVKDRLVFGMDQRWAYVSASMWYGKVPWIEKEVSEAEADEKLRSFVTDFAAKQIDWAKIKAD